MPSDLFQKYNCEGGFIMLEFDLIIAAEISERITEQTEQATNNRGNAKKAVARRNQKRATISSKQMGSVINDWVGE
jgi:hypothetical protein